MKRSLLSLFDNAPSAFDIPSCLIAGSRKKVKRALQIDIHDSFTEKPAALPLSTPRANARKLSFTLPPSPQPCCMVKTATTPRHSERGQAMMDQSFFPMESDSLYDDFYQQEEAFNITMKKCHRKRMEDRVILRKLNCA